MNVEMYQLEKSQFMSMHGEAPLEVAKAADLSSTILVGIFNSKPLCYIGLIPKTLTSDTAYVWMIVTELGERHPLLLALNAKRVRDRILAKYSCVWGHCFGSKSIAWLTSFGAKFVSEIEFEFRRG